MVLLIFLIRRIRSRETIFFFLSLIDHVNSIMRNNTDRIIRIDKEIFVRDISMIDNDFKVKVKFFRDARELYLADAKALTPEAEGLYATPCAAGLDLRVCFTDPAQQSADISPGARLKLPAGLAVEPNSGKVAGFVYSRSGLGAKEGLCVAQGVGVIDPDYRGEIFLYLLNTSGESRRVERGERVAQLIFQPFFRPGFCEAAELGGSLREAGGFGHSGKF